MKRLLLGLLFLPSLACAQSVPPLTTACATMSVPNSSTTVVAANTTACTNSSALPTVEGTSTWYFENDASSTAGIILCPLGGTCASANGVTIAPGASKTRRLTAGIVPTVISATGTQKLYVEVQR